MQNMHSIGSTLLIKKIIDVKIDNFLNLTKVIYEKTRANILFFILST